MHIVITIFEPHFQENFESFACSLLYYLLKPLIIPRQNVFQYLESSVDDVKRVVSGKQLGHAAQRHRVRVLNREKGLAPQYEGQVSDGCSIETSAQI